MMESLRFTPELLTPPPAGGIDAITTLRHFAIVTYCVEPEALRPYIHPRFALETITDEAGHTWALLSVVPFEDVDFRFVRFPWLKWRFGQTNYRVYVRDGETGEHVVWFLGTTLASWTAVWPRYGWRLPWHKASIQFDTAYDEANGRYTRYEMHTPGGWAAVELALADSGEPPPSLPGFPDLETGLVLLTHPLRGYYYRRDGSLGSYHIWHNRLTPTYGRLLSAQFHLLADYGLVPLGETSRVHSVLMQPETEFTIYLPPHHL
jgi:hypothetical protein